jgi:transposase-like protein
MFNNLRELIATMPDEKTCRDYVIQQRWNGKPVCPYCGYDRCYIIEGGKRFKCASKTCYSKFSVTVGTIMEDSNIPICKWLTAIYLCTAHKKGISSYQLGKDIGVAQKSAWFMLHRIRNKMLPKIDMKLDNTIEADLTFIGGSISNKSNKVRKEYLENKRPLDNKTSVLGITERQGNTIMQVVPNNEEKKVDKMVRDNVEFAANVITDEGSPFVNLNDNYYHYRVNHSKNEYARLHFHTNSIEGVFSHFKRMVYGIYHQISYKHTQQYLNEFTYRFNSRGMKDADRFALTMKNLEGRLTYKQLVSAKDKEQKVIKVKQPLNAYKAKAVIQLLDGVIIGEYPSIRQAERETKISNTSITACIKGRLTHAGGYKWILA